jgi:uncharacterized protein YbjT (DUF2867 family)
MFWDRLELTVYKGLHTLSPSISRSSLTLISLKQMADDQKTGSIHRVAVCGASGQMGIPLTKALLGLGHFVLAISRSPESHPKVAELVSHGARAFQIDEYENHRALAQAFAENQIDTVVVVIQGSTDIIRVVEPLILKAAQQSGTVKRFVPNEFGVHTLGIDYGLCVLFDAKKDFHKLLFDSGLEWTLIYGGGYFDYFLPNFRLFKKITTFGDLNVKFPTHDVPDIAQITARAVTDSRTANHAVQIAHNVVTQAECLDMLRENWPDCQFDVDHISSEYIIEQKDHAGDEVTAKGGKETDRERFGINYVIYVLGKLFDLKNELTLNADDLYPDYKFRTPAEAYADKDFVFGKPK